MPDEPGPPGRCYRREWPSRRLIDVKRLAEQKRLRPVRADLREIVRQRPESIGAHPHDSQLESRHSIFRGSEPVAHQQVVVGRVLAVLSSPEEAEVDLDT